MQQSIIIRVAPENFDIWRKEHDGQQEARLDYGITDGPFYRDERDPNVALVHLNVENLATGPWRGSRQMRSKKRQNGPVASSVKYGWPRSENNN